jgi:hypothetical protein
VAEVPQTLPEPVADFALAISVSESPDLARLGLTETHLRMALGEVARAVLIARGRLAYAGHLDPTGYTEFLVREIERYRSRDKPFTGYLPWPVHRTMDLTDIDHRKRQLGLLGEYVLLDVDGRPIDDPEATRGEEAAAVDEATAERALTAARKYTVRVTDGRLVVGGQRAKGMGRIAGVVEEVIESVRSGQPVFLAGGFGGATADMAVALGLDPEGWLGIPDRRGDDGIAELLELVAETGWTPQSNGLSMDQNRQLAVSYRASEIASFVVNAFIHLQGPR